MSCRVLIVPSTFLCLVLIGCQREPDPVKVSGTVSFDSKPLKDGAIYFSTPGKPPEKLEITNGKFEGSVRPGEKRVEIYGYEGNAMPDVPAGEQPPAPTAKKNIVPDRYNEKSTLKASVSASGVQPGTFDLQSN